MYKKVIEKIIEGYTYPNTEGSWVYFYGDELFDIAKTNKKFDLQQIFKVLPETKQKDNLINKYGCTPKISGKDAAYFFSYLYLAYKKVLPSKFWQFDLLTEQDKIKIQHVFYRYISNFYKRIVLKNLNWSVRTEEKISHTDILLQNVLCFSGDTSLIKKIYLESVKTEELLNVKNFESFSLFSTRIKNIEILNLNHIEFLKNNTISKFNNKKFLKNTYAKINPNTSILSCIYIHGFISFLNKFTKYENTNKYDLLINDFLEKNKDVLYQYDNYISLCELINNKILSSNSTKTSQQLWNFCKIMFNRGYLLHTTVSKEVKQKKVVKI